VARALVRSRLEDRGIRPEDVLPEAGPALVHTTVPDDTYVNAVTDAGLRALHLPATYPLDGRGRIIAHAICHPVGQLAWEGHERGIACRSATRGAPARGEELAYFDRTRLRAEKTDPFPDWLV
jgi:hypothetical protein